MDADKDIYCSLDGTTKSYCTPESYKGTASKLFRNLGGGRFEDVSPKAGVGDPTSKSLGVAVLDYDADGWPDIFVANDTQPNKLYRNNRDGTFTEKGVAAGRGVLRGRRGARRHGRGRGRLRPLGPRRTCWSATSRTRCWRSIATRATACSSTRRRRRRVGRASLLSLAFGVFFFDYDLDGRPDIFAVNGHIEEEIGRVQPKVQYKQIPLHVPQPRAGAASTASAASLGPAFNVPQVGRGAAYGDYDRDGDLDILITNNQGPARLLRNDGGNRNHWLTIAPSASSRTATASAPIVRVETPSGTQWQTVHSGSSYCSQSDLALTFGLGQRHDGAARSRSSGRAARRIASPTWPANQFVKIEEGRGLLK